jgi:hypothetical protein
LLSADLNDFTPEGIMLKTVMSDRYAIWYTPKADSVRFLPFFTTKNYER